MRGRQAGEVVRHCLGKDLFCALRRFLCGGLGERRAWGCVWRVEGGGDWGAVEADVAAYVGEPGFAEGGRGAGHVGVVEESWVGVRSGVVNEWLWGRGWVGNVSEKRVG